MPDHTTPIKVAIMLVAFSTVKVHFNKVYSLVYLAVCH